MRIGALIARIRRRACRSQVELAEAIYSTPNTVSNWERGAVQIPAVALMQVCYACGTTPGDFFYTLLEEDDQS